MGPVRLGVHTTGETLIQAKRLEQRGPAGRTPAGDVHGQETIEWGSTIVVLTRLRAFDHLGSGSFHGSTVTGSERVRL